MKRDEIWELRVKQIEEWRTSGLTQRAYCERAGIAFQAFRYWRRKLGERSPEQQDSAPGFVAVGVADTGRARIGRVAGRRTEVLVQPLEVVLSSGRRLKFVEGFEEAGLGRLIRLLEDLPC